MSASREAFLDAMSRVAATVTIVTTDGATGPFGMTVSAMSSVSADTTPPMLLVCVNRACRGAAPILANRVFGVNILRADQADLADIFAGRSALGGAERFAAGAWLRGASGAPLLEDALATFDCRLVRDIMVGEHHVLFGAVEAVRTHEGDGALVYVDRRYASPTALPAFPTPSQISQTNP